MSVSWKVGPIIPRTCVFALATWSRCRVRFNHTQGLSLFLLKKRQRWQRKWRHLIERVIIMTKHEFKDRQTSRVMRTCGMIGGEGCKGHPSRSLDEITELLEPEHQCGWAGRVSSCHQREYFKPRFLEGDTEVGDDKVKITTMELGSCSRVGEKWVTGRSDVKKLKRPSYWMTHSHEFWGHLV